MSSLVTVCSIHPLALPDLTVSNTKETAVREEDLISFDSLKLKGSVQPLKDKPRVLPTPPVSGAPSSTTLPIATDPEASLLVRHSRPAVTTGSTPSADSQDLMSFESIVPQTTQTVLSYQTQPRILPVPPPQSTARTVSPDPSSYPTGSLVNQPLLLDALSTPNKPRPRPDWVHFTVSCCCGSQLFWSTIAESLQYLLVVCVSQPPSSQTKWPSGGDGGWQPPFHIPSADQSRSANVHGANKHVGGVSGADELHPFTTEGETWKDGPCMAVTRESPKY